MATMRCLCVVTVFVLIATYFMTVPVASDEGRDVEGKEVMSLDKVEWLNPKPGYTRYHGVDYDVNKDEWVIVGSRGAFVIYDGIKFENKNPSMLFDLWDIEWRPSGDYALAVGGWGHALIWDGGTVEKLKTNNRHEMKGVAWNDDGTMALICADYGKLVLFDHSSQTFTEVESGIVDDLANVSYDPAVGWMIVGENGTVLKYHDGTVTRLDSGTNLDLHGVDLRSGKAVIVGEKGTILKYSAGKIEDANNVHSKDKTLLDVDWKPGGNQALIVGEGGTLLEYTETSINPRNPGVDTDLYRVAYQSSIVNNAFIVGAQGVVIQYDGTTGTSLVNDPFQGNYKDVAWNPTGSLAFIVGTSGTVLKYNNSVGLHYINSNTSATLRTIGWKPGAANEALIGGDGGTLMFYNGVNLTHLDTGTSNDLRGLAWRHDGQYALVVGEGGTVYKYEPGAMTPITLEGDIKNDMWSVAWHPSDDYAIIVGASGFIFKCTERAVPPHDVECKRLTSGFVSYQSVEFDPTGDYALVGGFSGYVGVLKDNIVTKVDTPTSQTALDISWKSGSDSAFVVCGGGVVMKLVEYSQTGPNLVKLPVPSIVSLYGISWNGNTALIVGDKGQIFKYTVIPMTGSPSAVIWKPYNTEEFSLNEDIVLDGRKSLPVENGVLDFSWKKNGTTLLSNEPYDTIQATDLGLGVHNIVLTVMSTGGKSDSDQISVRIVLDPRPPVPRMSSPENGSVYLTTDTIEFDGRNSTDPNGDGLTFHWYSNDSFVGYIASGDHFFQKISVPGVHEITMWANDSVFNESTSVEITVVAPNDPPAVNIKQPANGSKWFDDEDVIFLASATDPDGDPLTFRWLSSVTGFLSDEEDMIMKLEAGIHNITFFADDGHGHNVSFSIEIEVMERPPPDEEPEVRVTSHSNGDEISGIVTLMGTARDKDVLGNISKVQLQIGASDQWLDLTVENGSWSYTFDSVQFDNGRLDFDVKAYDNTNNLNITSIELVIANKWKDLTVSILAPLEDVEVSGTLQIEGWADVDTKDPDRNIAHVEIMIEAGETGKESGVTGWVLAAGQTEWFYRWDTAKADNGEYRIIVKAVDSEGTESIVDSVNVTVKNEPLSLLDSLGGQMMVIVVVFVILILVMLAMLVTRSRTKGQDDAEDDWEDDDEGEEEEDEGGGGEKEDDDEGEEEEHDDDGEDEEDIPKRKVKRSRKQRRH